MENQSQQARIAALSIAHASALGRLLRAHGRDDQAAELDRALEAVMGIISKEVGVQALSQAMSWVSDQTWNCDTSDGNARPN